MSTQLAIVKQYLEGVLKADKEQVLAHVTDDVVWEVVGRVKVQGKKALEGVVSNPVFAGPPTLTVDRWIEHGDTVIAKGAGSAVLAAGGQVEFFFCDVFTVTGGAISQVESYKVNREEPGSKGP
ncbi:nuclear transport factor 2 family protein [Streptomyces profundus]|uniref:nuclear transport factor 2 family protein n=1 Tax=Streptomyces profundus TaxID=2867410 RepID=UPI001D1630A8|nr:nuclear transport factor 2 family protein [Streptomyces sp. MA3_2.13]UED85147.1 nuclear transport factor 2 family protein [Streptomyces sp. MA3_2.13]